MSKRIKVSTIIDRPLNEVWDEVKIMENHVNWMQDAAKIDFLSENKFGMDTKMKVLTKVLCTLKKLFKSPKRKKITIKII